MPTCTQQESTSSHGYNQVAQDLYYKLFIFLKIVFNLVLVHLFLFQLFHEISWLHAQVGFGLGIYWPSPSPLTLMFVFLGHSRNPGTKPQNQLSRKEIQKKNREPFPVQRFKHSSTQIGVVQFNTDA